MEIRVHPPRGMRRCRCRSNRIFEKKKNEINARVERKRNHRRNDITKIVQKKSDAFRRVVSLSLRVVMSERE